MVALWTGCIPDGLGRTLMWMGGQEELVGVVNTMQTPDITPPPQTPNPNGNEILALMEDLQPTFAGLPVVDMPCISLKSRL